jgi:hypothetical protein
VRRSAASRTLFRCTPPHRCDANRELLSTPQDLRGYDIEMHRRLPPILITAFCLAIASSALALPVEVEFSGSISNVDGVAPGGIVATTAFSGALSYDPGADQNPSSGRFELPGSAFSLQLDVGGTSFENDSQPGPLHAWYEVSWVDEDGEWGEPFDPGAVPLLNLFGVGYLRDVDTNDEYSFSLKFSMLIDAAIPSYLPGELPPTSLELAEFMTDGPLHFGDFLYIGNASDPPTPYLEWPSVCGAGPSGFCVGAEVQNVTPVPEPSTASLLLLGLAAVGAVSRVRRSTTH